MALKDLLADTRPLRTPTFRRLWSANIVTVIGAQVTIVAIPAQLYALTGQSSYVGLAGLFGLVPLVIFGLYGGALADVMDRRILMLGSGCGLVAASFGLFLLSALGSTNVWLLLSIYAIQQMFFALNQPARSAILPAILPGGQLPAANALNMTLMTFGAVVGPLVGGMLIPVIGFSFLYLFDALALLVSVWAIWKLPSLPPQRAGEAAGPGRRRAGVRSVVDGFAYLITAPVLLMSFVVDIIAMVFGMPRALFPQIAHETFGGPGSGGFVFALLSAAIPFGALLGGIFSGWVSRVNRQGRAVVICILVWGAAMTGFGLVLPAAGNWWMFALIGAVLFLAIGGVADVVSAAFRMTILQQAADDAVRGRLQGVFIVVVAGGPRIADVLHGYVATGIGTTWATAGGGVLVIIGVLIAAAAAPSFTRYRVR
ncbi:MFS transporter [Brevibacterium luteolum]|uniref:MFS transporter n=1 Tax=Brevibacterium luteolum TaxID=199591 RepID=A0A2N6PHG3_9MICO|nr:MFS transporter [Brevibacterium luteolum]MCT1658074.1 MFS transporter [Brevibacterium luteolum]PMB98125.1 MFS transporter [Brevibacterium luteolum]